MINLNNRECNYFLTSTKNFMKIKLIPVADFCKITLMSTLTIVLFMLYSCKKVQEKISTSDPQSKSAPHNNISQVDIKLISDNLVSPIGIVAIPDNDKRFDEDKKGNDSKSFPDDKRLFVIDHAGKIRIIDVHENMLPVPFLDVT